MRLVISARCCSSSRDFHLLQAGSTLQSWICVRDWNGLLMQSLSLWLPLYLHRSWLYMPPAAAAFIGALTAGLLASFIKKSNGYPRISLTVPSIVIMVPGLYLYRAIYNFGIMSLTDAVSWFTSAIMIIVMLPIGLIFARILTDRTFRYCT
mgnify:FL=1